MKEFTGRVAVITGAASGIGRALAHRFGAEGMKLVLADVEIASLLETEAELKARGFETRSVQTDVSKAEEVEQLANVTVSEFGGVHVLCNNAGVFAAGVSWLSPLADWEWVLGVNFWGVLHGLRSFLPLMLAQETDGHIVNTASVSGLTSAPYASPYQVSKHAVVTLSESLYHELKFRGARVKVSVLCPGPVQTQIGHSERNRPSSSAPERKTPEQELTEKALQDTVRTGLAPERVAEQVLDAIRNERVYILTDPAWKQPIQARLEDILNERDPSLLVTPG